MKDAHVCAWSDCPNVGVDVYPDEPRNATAGAYICVGCKRPLSKVGDVVRRSLVSGGGAL